MVIRTPFLLRGGEGGRGGVTLLWSDCIVCQRTFYLSVLGIFREARKRREGESRAERGSLFAQCIIESLDRPIIS